MNWGDIGKLVKPLAPTLGTILGGPLGGIAGALLGSVLGMGGGGQSPITPENVGKAIEQGGAAIQAAIQSAEQEAQARWGFMTEAVKEDAIQGQAINETIRSEIAQGVSWWHWRNLMGYSVLLQITSVLPILVVFLSKGNTTGVNEIISVATAFTPIITIEAALLGYVAGDTTRRITTAMVGEHAPSIMSALATAIKKGK